MANNATLEPAAESSTASESIQIRHQLGPASLTALGLGGLIGAGIFVTVGVAAHDKAGPAVILSLMVAAVACIMVALCYCECASRVPVAGSSYAYGYAATGRVGGWLSGWNLATCYFLAGAAVAQGWSGYLQNLLGAAHLPWPKAVSGAPFDLNPTTGALSATGSLLDLPALLALGAVTFIVYRGVRLSLTVNRIILIIKLSVLGAVILAGLSRFNIANWTPFAPFGYGGMSLTSLMNGGASTGMLAGAATVFFAFGGFEMLSAYSHECRNPRRDVPLGIVATIGLLTLLYIAVAVAITGMVPREQISISAPISDALRSAGMGWAQMAVAAGAIAGLSSVLLVIVMSLPRVLMAIGRDGLIPERVFNTIHPAYNTPHRSVAFVGVVAMLFASLLPLRMVMETVMMATLAGYISVCVFVLVLRKKSDSEPVFKAPLGPLVPLGGIAVCLVLMLALPPVNWLRLLAWWSLGLAVYAVRRSAFESAGMQESITNPVQEIA